MIVAPAVCLIFRGLRANSSAARHQIGAPGRTTPACGKPDDGNPKIPPNWALFEPPAKGHSYADPVFGCAVVRLTDAVKDGVAEHHYYSTLSPISADDSNILINNNHGGWKVVDLTGNVVVPVSGIPANNGGTLLWDARDGRSFYYTRENALMKGTIQGRSIKGSVVRVFKEYRTVLLPDKTDVSIDGQSIAMWGGSTTDVGHLNIFTYNMRTDVKMAPYVTTCLQIVAYNQGPCVHGITQTPDDKVIIGFAKDGRCKECGNRLWDGQNLTGVQDNTNHIGTGFDLQGRPVLIGIGGPSILPGERNPCPSGWGLDVRQLYYLPRASCLVDKQPSSHISYRGSASQPWVALSFFDDRKDGPEYFDSNSAFQAPSASNWRLYEDEVVLARIDGSTMYRLAHARSRSDEGYWAEPRAAISRDGKYVIFDSNMAYAKKGCPTGVEDCNDVYLMKVQ